MHSDKPLFDPALHHFGLSGQVPEFIVIGAMDGISFDEFHGFVRTYGWSGLFVEPIPEQFRRLQANFAQLGCSPNNRYENSAIAEHNGSVKMLTIAQEAVDTGQVHSCFGGMSAIYPPRNGLASAGDAETVARYGTLVEVPCITLQTLLSRHEVQRIDILCIDAEGWDWRILRQLDFQRFRPRLIRAEYINLDADEKQAIVDLFERHHYLIHLDGMNIDAVAQEHWQDISQAPSRPPARSWETLLDGLTLVTSLFNPAFGAESHRGSAWTDTLATLQAQLRALSTVPLPLMVFTQQEHVAALSSARASAPTYVCSRRAEDFRAQAFHAQLQALQPPQAPALHALLALSKPFFLNDATLYNPFSTEHFLWVDVEVLVDLPATELLAWLKQVGSPLLNDARMLLTQAPQSGEPGTARENSWVFGGHKQVINQLNGVYYGHLDRTLGAGQPCTLSTLWQQTLQSHPYLCHAVPTVAPRPETSPLGPSVESMKSET